MAKAEVSASVEELKPIALTLFADMSKTMAFGYTTEALVTECYRRANQFLQVTKKVGEGTVSLVPEQDEKREMVDVIRYRSRDDNGGWEQVFDEMGKPVVDKFPADPYAFAPNLPDEHPINQRFRPKDGIKASVRKRQAQLN